MTDFTPDFLRELVYREDEKRYVILSTCRLCGSIMVINAYTWVPGVERLHAEQCPGMKDFEGQN